MFLKLLILFSTLSFARNDDPDRPHKYDKPACNTGRFQSCLHENQLGFDSCASAISTITTETQLIFDEIFGYESMANPIIEKINIVYNSLSASQKEIDFLVQNTKKNASEAISKSLFFDDTLQLKNFFRLGEDTLTWNEMFPIERLNQLKKFEADENTKLISLQAEKNRLMQNITNLYSQIESYNAQKNEFTRASQAHAMMLKEGCKNLFCPSN